MDHRDVQARARLVLAELGSTLGPDDTERSIARRAVGLLERQGLGETWYHQCPALVLLGSRSTLSISGRLYEPAEEAAGDFNLVTVDLSPRKGDVWGDCARSFPVEEGQYVECPRDAGHAEGLCKLAELHSFVKTLARPDMTFSELHAQVERQLRHWGWENLDKGQNFGHSIASRLEDRLFLDASTKEQLGSVRHFTFEPHIRIRGGSWGYKHEDVYGFDRLGTLHAI